MKRLSVNDIKSLPDVPTQELKIDEWDVSVKIKGITKSMQIELGKLLENGELDAFDYQKELLKACIIDPELSDEDIDELYKKDSKIIDNIFLEINTLNGVGGSANADQFQD